jgi:ubiquinone/menaquinone biosynthesis C-methylase UbiE
MTGKSSDSLSDVWSDWLLHHRHADDPEFNRAVRARLELYADRVLDGARLASNMILADIGAGDGLVAFRAIERIGPSLRVLLTDVSAPMLQHAERFAIQHDIKHQCAFHQCPAENLKDIADASVDVVTTRAVLAYVADKNAAIREFYRVLKPGGSISIAEPIFRDEAFSATALKNIVNAHPLEPGALITHLLHRWKAAQFPDTVEKISESPIANYSERDLVSFAHASGFVNIHMELHIDVLPSAASSWKAFIESSPHPWAPPLSVVLAEQFTSEEREFFETIFRPQVESPQFCTIDRTAYLNAMKPL